MPPKKQVGQAPSKKTVEKKKEKVIEVRFYSYEQGVILILCVNCVRLLRVRGAG